MTPSQKCYDAIISFEGLELESYLDTGGVPTIGFGSTMYTDGSKVKLGQKIELKTAHELLKWEVDNKAKVVNGQTINSKLTQNQFDALVCFAYNVGVGAFSSSTMLKKIKINPNDISIRNEFMRWNKDNGKTVQGLTNRRKKEADLYFS